MRYVNLLSAVLIATTLAPFEDAGARVYKWVDEDGNVQYTQTRPPDRPAETVEPRYYQPPAPADGADPTTTKTASKEGDKPEKETEKEETEYADPKTVEEFRKKNCELARKNLETLQQPSGRIRIEDGKGGFLDDAGKQAKIEETKRQVAENCK